MTLGQSREREPKRIRLGEQDERVGLEGVAQSGSDEMAGMGRNVSSFVIRVKGDVELEILLESCSRLGLDRDESGELGREVSDEVALSCCDERKLRVLVVDVSEDSSGEVGEFSNEIKGIVERASPVFGSGRKED